MVNERDIPEDGGQATADKSLLCRPSAALCSLRAASYIPAYMRIPFNRVVLVALIAACKSAQTPSNPAPSPGPTTRPPVSPPTIPTFERGIVPRQAPPLP